MGTLNADRRAEIDHLRKLVATRLERSVPGVWVVLKRYDGTNSQQPYKDYRAVMSGGFDRTKYLIKAVSRDGCCELRGMRLGGK